MGNEECLPENRSRWFTEVDRNFFNPLAKNANKSRHDLLMTTTKTTIIIIIIIIIIISLC